MSGAEIDLYFDFACPWSYIGLLRLQDAADRNAAKILLKPISLNTLLTTENPNKKSSFLAENPAKASWQVKDLRKWYEMWGIELKFPEKWPFDSKISTDFWLSRLDSVDALGLALAIFGASFRHGLDVSDGAVLEGLVCDLERHEPTIHVGPSTAESTSDSGYTAKTTQELIRRGGFGTPTMFLDEEMFFGNDRVPLLEYRLGPMGDGDFVVPGQHGAAAGLDI